MWDSCQPLKGCISSNATDHSCCQPVSNLDQRLVCIAKLTPDDCNTLIGLRLDRHCRQLHGSEDVRSRCAKAVEGVFQLHDLNRVPGIARGLSGAIDGRPADYRRLGRSWPRARWSGRAGGMGRVRRCALGAMGTPIFDGMAGAPPDRCLGANPNAPPLRVVAEMATRRLAIGTIGRNRQSASGGARVHRTLRMDS